MITGFNNKSKAVDTSQTELVLVLVLVYKLSGQLYQQIGQLTVERDWLKKSVTRNASNFSCSHTKPSDFSAQGISFLSASWFDTKLGRTGQTSFQKIFVFQQLSSVVFHFKRIQLNSRLYFQVHRFRCIQPESSQSQIIPSAFFN